MTEFQAVLFVVLWDGALWWVYRRLTRGTFQDQVAEHITKEAANGHYTGVAQPLHVAGSPLGRLASRARLRAVAGTTGRWQEQTVAASLSDQERSRDRQTPAPIDVDEKQRITDVLNCLYGTNLEVGLLDMAVECGFASWPALQRECLTDAEWPSGGAA